HCRSSKLAFRSRAIEGSATATMFVSSKSMKVPAQTTPSVHHLRALSSGAITAPRGKVALCGAVICGTRRAAYARHVGGLGLSRRPREAPTGVNTVAYTTAGTFPLFTSVWGVEPASNADSPA